MFMNLQLLSNISHLFVGYLSLVLFVMDGFSAFLVLDADGFCIIPGIICGWILHNPLYNL